MSDFYNMQVRKQEKRKRPIFSGENGRINKMHQYMQPVEKVFLIHTSPAGTYKKQKEERGRKTD